jgi:hypothetical protein
MVKFINSITHTEMWVADNRVDEYIAAGHTPAVDGATEEKPAEPKKRTTKKK